MVAGDIAAKMKKVPFSLSSILSLFTVIGLKERRRRRKKASLTFPGDGGLLLNRKKNKKKALIDLLEPRSLCVQASSPYPIRGYLAWQRRAYNKPIIG